MFRSPLTDGILAIVILLLIVGPKKLPQLGRGLGDGMREFKEGITGEHKHEEQKQSLTEAHAMPITGTTEERPSQTAATPGHDAGADRS
jgi:sec-independent protein translocase protein TatA